jgi:hypothetical protein
MLLEFSMDFISSQICLKKIIASLKKCNGLRSPGRPNYGLRTRTVTETKYGCFKIHSTGYHHMHDACLALCSIGNDEIWRRAHRGRSERRRRRHGRWIGGVRPLL